MTVVDNEALRRTFSTLRDEELLRRWDGPLTDEAREVARNEIEHRGLHVTEAALSLLRAQDEADQAAFKAAQRERGREAGYGVYRAYRPYIWAIVIFGGLAILQQIYQALTGG